MTATNATTCTTEVPADAFEARVRALPLELALGHDADNEWKLNSILTTWPYLTGEMPWHWNIHVSPVDAGQSLIPSAGVLMRSCEGHHGESRVVAGEAWVATIARQNDGSLWVSLSAESEAVAQPILDEVRGWAVTAPVEPDRVPVSFMYCGNHGAYYTHRRLDVPAWADIRRNYVKSVATKVDGLVALREDTVPNGRLLLMHGPPGTGKTTLVRALSLAWKGWCRTCVVVDPEALFSNPGYMFEAVLGEDDDEFAKPWRLFVVEDCDEFIRADSKERTGQALSRLLNIADGLIGQGIRVIICITTNESVGALHPAVRRPGRCLAEIEVPRLNRADVRNWLGGGHVGADGASLAELYAVVNGEAELPGDEPVVAGQYL